KKKKAINGLRAILSQIDDLSTSLRTWSGSTLDLFLLEMKVNVAAARQIVMFSIIFTLLSVLFIFSVCLVAGVVTYHFTAQLLLSVGVFIVSLGLALVGLAWWQKRLTHFLGFKNTTDQLQEGWHAFSNQPRPSHADKTHRG
ncbi:phage holin family protein, partial [Vibrio parahaemolyticus]|uniref:phage holin family protein n=2 Tax=Vibrio parahaemolyticus TaxID=670 RepID=UPI000472F067